MKRRDNGKASLVEFMRSIKFTRHKSDNQSQHLPEHFAHLNSQVRNSQVCNDEAAKAEEANLIRSAN